MQRYRLPVLQGKTFVRSYLETVSDTNFDQVDFQFLLRNESAKLILAFEFQGAGILVAVAQIQGHGITQLVAHSGTELPSESRVGVLREFWYEPRDQLSIHQETRRESTLELEV